jgi:hypothetical protein
MRRIPAYAGMGVALLALLLHHGGSAAATCSLGSLAGTHEIYNAHSDLVAEVYHSQTADYANVDQYHSNDTSTQWWTFNLQFCDNSGNPVVTIVNANSGKCMETYHSQTTDYANVDQYHCNDSATQEWVVIFTGQYNANFINWNSLVNGGSRECLEVYHSETTDYANVDQYFCNGTMTQEWYWY